MVAQPGVEFSDAELFDYEPKAGATSCDNLLRRSTGLVYEAHSTDYQTRESLSALVHDHFAVLKVGLVLRSPIARAPTRCRSSKTNCLESDASGLREVLDLAMTDDPSHWNAYYPSEPRAQALGAPILAQRSLSLLLAGVECAVGDPPDDVESSRAANPRRAGQPVPSDVSTRSFVMTDWISTLKNCCGSKIREVLDDYLAATTLR